jgi:long-chain acyl-CoA synthetase
MTSRAAGTIVASREHMPPEPESVRAFFEDIETIPDVIDKRARLSPDRPAHFVQDQEGRWHPKSWAEFASASRRVASFYTALQLAHGDRVAILAATSQQWELCQIGAMRLGMAVIGIDPYYPAEQVNEILAELRPAALVVGDEDLWKRVSPEVRSTLRAAIMIAIPSDGAPLGVVALPNAPQDSGDPSAPDTTSRARKDDVAVVVFSSGTTGIPKSIAYTHEQVCIACRAILEAYQDLEEDCNMICWMPLANLFQRIINFCAAAKGAMTYIISDPRWVVEAMPTANPRIFVTVPRFCERLYHGIQEHMSKLPRPLGGLLRRALEANTREFGLRWAGKSVPLGTRLLAWTARATVVKRLRALMGSNIRYFVCGSAPCPQWLQEFYGSLGIPILEAYGQSENIVPIAANTLARNKPGTVGHSLRHNEVRITDEGAIEVRGPGVFRPELPENKSRPPLTPDEYLVTGDLGEFDADGFLRLTGRATEVFKAANGRWISPQDIEAALRRVPYVEQAALVNLDAGVMIAVVSISITTCPYLRSHDGSASTARLSEDAREMMDPDFRAVLAALPSVTRPHGLLLTMDAFTVEGGELTTNFKLRRDPIARKYQQALTEFARDIAASGQAASDEIRVRTKAV